MKCITPRTDSKEINLEQYILNRESEMFRIPKQVFLVKPMLILYYSGMIGFGQNYISKSYGDRVCGVVGAFELRLATILDPEVHFKIFVVKCG